MRTLIALSLASLVSTASADEIAPGFDSAALPTFLSNDAVRNLSDGTYLTNSGQIIRRWTAAGTLIGQLGSFASWGTPGLMAVNPGENFVLVGNKTTGEILKLGLAGGFQQNLGFIPGNQDAAFETNTVAVISAGSALIRMDTNTGATTVLASIDGLTGPVAVDVDENVYYGTVSSALPMPAGAGSLLRFDKGLLANPPAPVFQAHEGLVVIEIESVPPDGDWTESTFYPGFTGESYYRWDGPDLFSSPGSGILTYDFEVVEDGNYEFHFHNRHDDPLPDQDNDCWVRVDGGPWLKVFSNFGTASVGVWNWFSTVEEDSGAQYQANWDLTPGKHTVQLSGRSNGFKLDRMVFFRNYVPSPMSLTQPESVKAPFNQSDAQVVTGGLDGPTEMVHDAELDRLILAENNPNTGLNRIRRIATSGAAETLITGNPFNELRNLDFTGQPGPSAFLAFQDIGNGFLAYGRGNAGGLNEHRALVPTRAELSLSGPGTGGLGQVTLTVTGAHPSSLVLLAQAPAALVSAHEIVIPWGGLPILPTGLPATGTTIVPTPVPSNPSGVVSLNFTNTLGATGVLGIQAVILAPSGLPVGTSTTAIL